MVSRILNFIERINFCIENYNVVRGMMGCLRQGGSTTLVKIFGDLFAHNTARSVINQPMYDSELLGVDACYGRQGQ
jgi:hypothetical protein